LSVVVGGFLAVSLFLLLHPSALRDPFAKDRQPDIAKFAARRDNKDKKIKAIKKIPTIT
jgi:hypothetical protein